MTDFIMPIGTDWSRSIIYKDSLNAVINLTGYTAKMQVRATKESHDTLKILDLSSPSSGMVIDGAAGKITITIGHALLTEPALKLSGITSPAASLTESSNLTGYGKIAYYDIMLTAPSGTVTKLLSGKVCFDASVTRG